MMVRHYSSSIHWKVLDLWILQMREMIDLEINIKWSTSNCVKDIKRENNWRLQSPTFPKVGIFLKLIKFLFYIGTLLISNVTLVLGIWQSNSITYIYAYIWYIYTVEYYSMVKMSEKLPFTAAWMDLEIFILSEVGQIQEG